MTALFALVLLLGELPPLEDQPLPAGALTGPASTRFALPVSIGWGAGLTDDTTPLVKDDGTTRAGSTRDVVGSLAKFAPHVARRHFEDAKWADPSVPRALMITSMSVKWRSGPYYEVHVEVERFEGTKRLGQASGTGYATATRNQGQRVGAGYASAFGVRVKNGLTEANPATDTEAIRSATLQALDSALMQLSAVWGGEQMMQKAREDAEAMMRKAPQPAPMPATKKKK